MRDPATLNQLLVLANLESYNAILINQEKNQKERMKLLRQLAIQQLQMLETVSLNNLAKLEIDTQRKQCDMFPVAMMGLGKRRFWQTYWYSF